MEPIGMKAEEYQHFLRDRISELLKHRNMSEYELSYALGKNSGYINKITRGKSNPSMMEFFNICEFFEIKPTDFFNPQITNPTLIENTIQKVKKLKNEDLELINLNIDRLLE